MWRVPKAPSREHGATRQRSGEACNAPQGWSRPKGRVPKAPSVEDSSAKGSLSTERGQTVPAQGPELHGPNEFGTRNRTAPQTRSL